MLSPQDYGEMQRDSDLINTQTPFQGSKGFDPPTPAEK